MLAAEALPCAGTGDLGEVMAALPAALATLGIEVTVILPGYRSALAASGGAERLGRIRAPVASRLEPADVLRVTGAPVPTVLVHAPRYFDREGLYGDASGDYADNAERFAFFCRAALEWLRLRETPTDVLHCHDWQAGPAAAMLRATAALYPELRRVRIVQTIHDLAYQGRFPARDWPLLNLDERYFASDWLESWGEIGFLKAGLVFADLITTASPRYAREIQTPGHGHGLDGVMRARAPRLRGILHGIDYHAWNPATDPALPARYDAGDPAGKRRCRAALRRDVDLLPGADAPLLAIVSRLSRQKGIDVALEALPEMLERDEVRLLVLGEGDPGLAQRLHELADHFPHRAAVRTDTDGRLAHRALAGADMLLVPSRYEPCGLTQLRALRYGTVPIVHATGGLADTVVEFDPATGAGTGFTFAPCDPEAVRGAVRRSIAVWRDPRAWERLCGNAMRQDYSAERSARAYATLYGALLASPSAA